MGTDYEERKKIFWVIELFYILILVVIQLHRFQKSQNSTLKRVNFTMQIIP